MQNQVDKRLTKNKDKEGVDAKGDKLKNLLMNQTQS